MILAANLVSISTMGLFIQYSISYSRVSMWCGIWLSNTLGPYGRHEIISATKTTSNETHDGPESLVHSSCFLMSSAVTVGRVVSSDLRKSFSFNGGSKSSSLSISDQDFSCAAGSPGEHGVHLSLPSSSTCLKCVAESTFRTGCIKASRTTVEISEPEYLKEVG